jgi:hypothetical protein
MTQAVVVLMCDNERRVAPACVNTRGLTEHLSERRPLMQTIPLTRGRVSLVDDEDYAAVMAAGSWQAHRLRDGSDIWYAVRRQYSDGKRRHVALHTFLTGWSYVDHINSDGLDNRRSNLRPVNASLNSANRRISSRNTSGYKGVSFQRSSGWWHAYIKVNQRRRHLGYFDTAEAAAHAYDAAALDIWGEYARTNFPVSQR